jgi:hypothetical protein
MVSGKGVKRGDEETVETISVNATGDLNNVTEQARLVLVDGDGKKRVRLVGVGVAVGKTVAAAERVKKALKGLHQCTSYAPVEVKAEDGKKKSKATQICIELANSSDALDISAPGYQAPDATGASPKKRRAESESAMPLKKKVAAAYAAKQHFPRSGGEKDKAAPSA